MQCVTDGRLPFAQIMFVKYTLGFDVRYFGNEALYEGKSHVSQPVSGLGTFLLQIRN